MSIKASKTARKAILAFADGQVFYGRAFGSQAQAVGTIVFDTGMSGYQEVLTNPTNSDRFICFTYPHIGNYGINAADFESEQAWAKAVIVRDLPLKTSNFRSEQTFVDFAEAQGVVGVTDIDTRQIVHAIRKSGPQAACIMSYAADEEAPVQAAQAAAQAFAKTQGEAAEVQTTTFGNKTYTWQETTWDLETGFSQPGQSTKFHLVVHDLGVRKNLLREWVQLGAEVTVVPANMPAKEVLALKPDAVYISSGAGPAQLDAGFMDALKQALDEYAKQSLPVFAEGYGALQVALAFGAQVEANTQAHLSQSHPVFCRASSQVLFTQQDQLSRLLNKSFPAELEVTHHSLFDQSIQGYQHQERPLVGFIPHPETRLGSSAKQPLLESFSEFIETRLNLENRT